MTAGWNGRGDRAALSIGLVNNMPDGALRATERQFVSLLHEAAAGMPLDIVLLSLPSIPRSARGQAYLSGSYRPVADMWPTRLDGLVVTGTEPRAESLRHEPYWPHLETLVGWAAGNTLSTIWLCLAAHAAVLCLDGIERQRLPAKLSGVFECRTVADHRLMAGLPRSARVVHSRLNGLAEHDLTRHGYTILSAAEPIGPDIFVQRRGSLFVFMQGHLEYDADTLLREYMRDLARFQAGQRETCPAIPSGYFEPDDHWKVLRLIDELTAGGSPDIKAVLQAGSQVPVRPSWRSHAVGIYRNWLTLLDHSRQQDGSGSHPGTRAVPEPAQVLEGTP